MSAAETLRLARDILVEKGWTQASHARSYDGARISPLSEKAVCFCAEGAIRAVCGSWTSTNLATAYLRKATGTRIDVYNDAPGRTLEEILARYDEAIAMAEQNLATAA